MSYIILNGVKSTEINGLLIQSLPPISKPLMRTQTEEIDGRDGDIVTKLGYSAYDKKMKIGLYGKYDVDEVIKYFDSEGTVIFSNEIDKYYNYQIIKEIDFERLIRFKTAEVTFHVQPFKYSSVDKEFILGNKYLKFDDYTETKNGVTLSTHDGVIYVSGTSTENTQFDLPMEKAVLKTGNYTLRAYAQGTGSDNSSMVIAGFFPTNSEHFALNLVDGETVSDQISVTGEKTYNALMVYVEAGNDFSFTLRASITNDSIKSLSLINRGNTFSKPNITVYGNGKVTLSINGKSVLTVNLKDEDWITIDSAQMNAYHGDTFRNRDVTGDYEEFVLPMGKSTISWTGNVSELIIEKFSRWI